MKFIAWLFLGLVFGASGFDISFPSFMVTLSQLAGGAFLFLAGWEMKFLDLRQDAKFFSITYLGTFLFPLACGYLLLDRDLFTAIAISISALPVAIQILKEKGLYDSRLARRTITLASLCDIAAWLMLAALLPQKQIEGWIAGHWIVFAFFAGLILGQFVPEKKWFAPVQTWILAPLFFISLGWRIDLLGLFDFSRFLEIFAIATVTKCVGSYVGARLGGDGVRDARDLMVLLNARGAMEIVAAQFAYSAKLIDGATFAALMVLGIVTSVMAIPLLRKSQV